MSLCFTTGDHNFIHRASTSSVTATTREANPYPVLVKELVHVSGNGPEEDSSCGDTRPSSLMDHSTRGRSEWDLPFKKVDPEVNRWRHMTGSQWKWTLPEVEKKSHPPRRWHLGLDIVICTRLSTYGAQSFLTVSVLSLSLSLIILADFFVVVLVCVLRFLFRIWCECKSETGKEWRVIACFLFYAYAALECDCF